jgi:hypothetical protein
MGDVALAARLFQRVLAVAPDYQLARDAFNRLEHSGAAR